MPCSQRPLTYNQLIGQLREQLDSVTIPEDFLKWAIKALRNQNEVEVATQDQILKQHQKNYEACLYKLRRLLDLYVSPENENRELLSDEDYREQKVILTKEKKQAASELRHLDQRVDEWLELTEKTFHFATYARMWLEEGDFAQKTAIIRVLGQNFTLTNGTLAVELKKPYFAIQRGLEKHPISEGWLELVKTIETNRESAKQDTFAQTVSAWSG